MTNVCGVLGETDAWSLGRERRAVRGERVEEKMGFCMKPSAAKTPLNAMNAEFCQYVLMMQDGAQYWQIV